MSQQYGGLPPLTPPSTPSNPITPPGLSWSDTWIRALTKPSVENYEQIASDAPPGSNSKAYTWIFIATIIAALINLIVGFVLPKPAIQGVDSSTFGATTAIVSLICVPVEALLSILIAAIIVGITQLIAGALGGKGSYSKLLYTSVAFSAPLTIIYAVLGIIPVVGLLTLPLGLYSIYLDILAVKAVNQFGWGKALLSSILIWVLVLIVVAVVVIVVLALLGPAIGNIFSNITANL